jgi:hypothetical protein
MQGRVDSQGTLRSVAAGLQFVLVKDLELFRRLGGKTVQPKVIY